MKIVNFKYIKIFSQNKKLKKNFSSNFLSILLILIKFI